MKNTLKNIVFAFIAILLVYSLSKNMFEYKSKLEFYEEYKTEYAQLQDKNKKLKTDLKKAQDYNFVEREIRDKLNLLKEDEVAIILPEISVTPTPTPAVEKEVWHQWLELFVN